MKKDRWNRVVTKRWFIFVNQKADSMKKKGFVAQNGLFVL